jgi:hypothetical protein
MIVIDNIILVFRLSYLAASWGGKDNGFGLSKCCSDEPISSFPPSATTLHFEFYAEVKTELQCCGSGFRFFYLMRIQMRI